MSHKHKHHESRRSRDRDISKPGKDGMNGKRGCRGKRGHEGDPGLQGLPGKDGLSGKQGKQGIVKTIYIKQTVDIDTNSAVFQQLGSLVINITTTDANSKLLIWSTFSSANDFPNTSNLFHLLVNGVQQEACGTSIVGVDNVEAGGIVVAYPAPTGSYIVEVQWRTTLGSVARIRPIARVNSEHADLLVMESIG